MSQTTSGSTQDKKTMRLERKKDGALLPTKVVMRRLPPSLTPEALIEQISPLPNHDFFYFVKADLSLGSNAFTRAYINFTNAEEIFNFRDRFDGYVFVDGKGNEYPAIVEFSPFQKVPKRKSKKPDAKKGTIEQDPDYVKFLKTLESPEEEEVKSLDSYLEDLEAREKEMKANKGCLKATTPLIEYLVRRKEEKRANMLKMQEERKKREQERRRLRDEERRKRREKEREQEKARERQRDKNADTKSEQTVKVLMKNPEREKESEKPSKSSDKSGEKDIGRVRETSREEEKRKEREKLRFSKENREKMKNEKGRQESGKTGRDGRGDGKRQDERWESGRAGKTDRKDQSKKYEEERENKDVSPDKRGKTGKNPENRDPAKSDRAKESDKGKQRSERDSDRKERGRKEFDKRDRDYEGSDQDKRDWGRVDGDKADVDRSEPSRKKSSESVTSQDTKFSCDGVKKEKDKLAKVKSDTTPASSKNKEQSTATARNQEKVVDDRAEKKSASKSAASEKGDKTEEMKAMEEGRGTPSPDVAVMSRSSESVEEGRPGSAGSETSEKSATEEKRRKRRDRPEREIYDPRKAAERRRLGQAADSKDTKGGDGKLSRQGSTDSKKTVSRQNSDESKKTLSRQNSSDSKKSVSRQNSDESKTVTSRRNSDEGKRQSQREDGTGSPLMTESEQEIPTSRKEGGVSPTPDDTCGEKSMESLTAKSASDGEGNTVSGLEHTASEDRDVKDTTADMLSSSVDESVSASGNKKENLVVDQMLPDVENLTLTESEAGSQNVDYDEDKGGEESAKGINTVNKNAEVGEEASNAELPEADKDEGTAV